MSISARQNRTQLREESVAAGSGGRAREEEGHFALRNDSESRGEKPHDVHFSHKNNITGYVRCYVLGEREKYEWTRTNALMTAELPRAVGRPPSG